jgi:glycosyltransferase involved in cell wall biosynthesis
VFDAIAVRPGSSAVILEGLIAGWMSRYPDDRLTVLVPDEPGLRIPEGVGVHRVPSGGGALGGLWNRTIGVRRAARELGADAVLSGVTASGLLGTGCRHGVVLTDLRHEVLPEQFSTGRRVARRLSYGASFRQADAILCISGRTRDDLVARHPGVGGRAIVASLGADHVDAWPARPAETAPYAVAFGRFANKNADAVLAAWAEFCRSEDAWTLRLVGMSQEDRVRAGERVAALGITDRVTLMPWLDDKQFAESFVGASLIVFPSEFEGFGLPAVEAMRLGIPLVVSADPALAEVTGGHAVIATDLTPHALADSMRKAASSSAAELAAAQAWAERFSWAAMADVVREALGGTSATSPAL